MSRDPVYPFDDKRDSAMTPVPSGAGVPASRCGGAAWRRSEHFAYAAELVGDAGGVDAVLRQHSGVVGVAGVDLVRQLAGGLAGLVLLALATQQCSVFWA